MEFAFAVMATVALLALIGFFRVAQDRGLSLGPFNNDIVISCFLAVMAAALATGMVAMMLGLEKFGIPGAVDALLSVALFGAMVYALIKLARVRKA